MASDDKPLIISDYARLQKKTLKSGKERYSIKISGDAVVVNANPKALAQPLATAIADLLRQRIQDIQQTAAPNTIKARESAKRNEGKPWVQKRYGGGKMGFREPNQTDRLFNDSGRLAESIVAKGTEDSWVVNIAANRLRPDMLGPGGLERIVTKLRELVPEFGDGQKLGDNITIRKALSDAQKNMLRKADQKTADLVVELIEQGLGLLK